ncbi:hypothetical protein RRG08_058503 [Elysia crispata]|uniref:Uncharacterized protein n=1 Tax=Elysia crispata TaxID=231223 RepID=A0AAE0ZW34_9GAST|nr:hypothetical protein RRG08_058503 [Elysia crispata]
MWLTSGQGSRSEAQGLEFHTRAAEQRGRKIKEYSGKEYHSLRNDLLKSSRPLVQELKPCPPTEMVATRKMVSGDMFNASTIDLTLETLCRFKERKHQTLLHNSRLETDETPLEPCISCSLVSQRKREHRIPTITHLTLVKMATPLDPIILYYKQSAVLEARYHLSE